MKKITSVSIDEDLLKKAQHSLMNISAVFEDAIKTKLNIKEIQINVSQDLEKCCDCQKELRKATIEDLNGLSWLYPDEKWICNSCLSRRSHHNI